MSDHNITLSDLREQNDHADEATDAEVFFEEFESALTAIKRATLSLRSRKDIETALDALREATDGILELQHAVLNYVADVEDGDEEQDEDEGDEEDGDEPSEESENSEGPQE